MADSA